ncbi:hypothetical protein BGZ59_008554 [Podila verticillata]|nr:hypothetical protein BGZ59_008554 [Podila verticillata]
MASTNDEITLIRDIVDTQPKKTSGMQNVNAIQSHAQEYPAERVSGVYGSMVNAMGALAGTLGMQGNIGLVSYFGKFYKVVDPGLTRVNPFTEKVLKVDMRVQISALTGQVIMTKDNVNIHIDSIIYWHIIDPVLASYGISDVSRALNERTKTTLRQVLGSRMLQEIIENRDLLAHEIQTIIDVPAHAWGVKVESILIKDIQFTKALQESLSSAAQAKRLAESKVIQAQSEVDSAKLMRQAAEFLNTPAAMQIRYLESMASMARHSGQKTIFMPTSDDVRTHFVAGPAASMPMPSASIAGPSGNQVLTYSHTGK